MATPTCGASGKRRYPDELTAIAAALRCSKRRGVALRVYRCPDCEAFHLTRRRRWVA